MSVSQESNNVTYLFFSDSYHKFTRGKDLSRISAEDMACIFGKRKDIAEQDSELQQGVGMDTSHGVVTYNSENSSKDYFSKRLKKLKSLKSTHSAVDNDDNGTSACFGKLERRKKRRREKCVHFGDELAPDHPLTEVRQYPDEETLQCEEIERNSTCSDTSQNDDKAEGSATDSSGTPVNKKKKKRKEEEKTCPNGEQRNKENYDLDDSSSSRSEIADLGGDHEGAHHKKPKKSKLNSESNGKLERRKKRCREKCVHFGDELVPDHPLTELQQYPDEETLQCDGDISSGEIEINSTCSDISQNDDKAEGSGTDSSGTPVTKKKKKKKDEDKRHPRGVQRNKENCDLDDSSSSKSEIADLDGDHERAHYKKSKKSKLNSENDEKLERRKKRRREKCVHFGDELVLDHPLTELQQYPDEETLQCDGDISNEEFERNSTCSDTSQNDEKAEGSGTDNSGPPVTKKRRKKTKKGEEKSCSSGEERNKENCDLDSSRSEIADLDGDHERVHYKKSKKFKLNNSENGEKDAVDKSSEVTHHRRKKLKSSSSTDDGEHASSPSFRETCLPGTSPKKSRAMHIKRTAKGKKYTVHSTFPSHDEKMTSEQGKQSYSEGAANRFCPTSKNSNSFQPRTSPKKSTAMHIKWTEEGKKYTVHSTFPSHDKMTTSDEVKQLYSEGAANRLCPTSNNSNSFQPRTNGNNSPAGIQKMHQMNQRNYPSSKKQAKPTVDDILHHFKDINMFEGSNVLAIKGYSVSE